MRWVVFAMFAVLAGCGISFPEEYRIEDLRVLEIRAEPPEVQIFQGRRTDLTAEQLGELRPQLTDVRLTALVALPDPFAAEAPDPTVGIGVRWSRCKEIPEVPGGPSIGFRSLPCEAEQTEVLGTGNSVTVSPVGLLFADIAALGEDAQQGIVALAEDPRDLFSGLYARFNLAASVSPVPEGVETPVLEATKRVVVFDPTLVALVIREARRRGPGGLPTIAGFSTPTLCTNLDEGSMRFIYDYLETRPPNAAPVYDRLEVLVPDSTSTVAWTPDRGPVDLAPGEQLVLRGRARDADFESFRLIDDKCRLVEFSETMAFSWFVTDGNLSAHLTSESTNPLANDTLRTTYTAPPIDEAERRVRIYSVLRDGRGGSDARFVDVRILR